ncbi:MAG: tetratricopeptide repeat protein [bacterium]|nr:tetratricopeptide repeat protein [Candidatus Sumerlaeota bacterium]
MILRALLIVGLAALAACPLGAAGRAKADPNRREAINLMAKGQDLEQQGKIDEALNVYQQSIKLAPSPAACYKAGQILAQKGDRATASQYYSQALQLNPDYELAKMELGQTADNGAGRNGGSQPSAGTSGGDHANVPGADGAMNIDMLQKENETLHSLRRPDNLAAAPDSTPAPTGYKSLFRGMIPRAPRNARAGSAPAIPKAPQIAAPSAPARNAMIPPQAALIEKETKIKVIEYHGDMPVAERAKQAGLTPDNVGVGKSLEPNNGMNASTVGKPAGDRTVQLPPAGDGALPDAGAYTGGAAPSSVSAPKNPASQAPAAGNRATLDQINQAAFGPEAQLQKGSVGFGNHTKVAVGTYAFHRDRADLYRKAGRFEDAAREYKTALELNPDNSETRALMAECLARSGKDSESKAQFDKAVASAPNDPAVYYRKGNLYREQKQPDLAIGAYLKAISLDPGNKFAHNNLGIVYMEKGEYPKAVTEFERVLEIDRKYDKAMLNLGIIYDDQLADDEQALKYYDMYIKAGGERGGEVKGWADAIRRKQSAPAPVDAAAKQP